MEFTYRISEADYIAAAKLRRRMMRKGPVRLVAIWVFILVCLMVLWALVQRPATGTASNADPQVRTADNRSDSTGPSSSPGLPLAVIFNVGPLVVLVAVWIFVFYNVSSAKLRKQYRLDPQKQGEISVQITPELYSSHSTTGAIWQIHWNNIESWIEKQNIVLIVMYSHVYFTLNTAGLTDAQRAELRGILSAAIPPK